MRLSLRSVVFAGAFFAVGFFVVAFFATGFVFAMINSLKINLMKSEKSFLLSSLYCLPHVPSPLVYVPGVPLAESVA